VAHGCGLPCRARARQRCSSSQRPNAADRRVGAGRDALPGQVFTANGCQVGRRMGSPESVQSTVPEWRRTAIPDRRTGALGRPALFRRRQIDRRGRASGRSAPFGLVSVLAGFDLCTLHKVAGRSDCRFAGRSDFGNPICKVHRVSGKVRGLPIFDSICRSGGRLDSRPRRFRRDLQVRGLPISGPSATRFRRSIRLQRNSLPPVRGGQGGMRAYDGSACEVAARDLLARFPASKPSGGMPIFSRMCEPNHIASIPTVIRKASSSSHKSQGGNCGRQSKHTIRAESP
jgi:hypothetical protein